MRRREFCTGHWCSCPARCGRAQQSGQPRRIGFLLVGLSTQSKQAQHFRQGMRDAGYSEGRNLVTEWREAKGDYDRVPELVSDLVRNKVELIVVDSTVATQVAMRTTTIPVVMALVVSTTRSRMARMPQSKTCHDGAPWVQPM